MNIENLVGFKIHLEIELFINQCVQYSVFNVQNVRKVQTLVCSHKSQCGVDMGFYTYIYFTYTFWNPKSKKMLLIQFGKLLLGLLASVFGNQKNFTVWMFCKCYEAFVAIPNPVI